MKSPRKIVKSGPEARQAIRNAVLFVGDRVKSTLGPFGKNALLDRDRDDRPPLITNDGVSIAKELAMDDECENLVAKTFVEAASRANDLAGDGTTTAATLAQKLILSGLDKIEKEDIAVMDLSNQMSEEANTVIEELKEMTKPITSKDQLIEVSVSSMERSNSAIAKMIAETVWDVCDGGKRDGVIVPDTNFINPFTEVEIVNGYRERAKYAAEWMQTNDKREMIAYKTPIVVTNLEFEYITDVSKIILALQQKTKAEGNDANNLVIFGKKFSSNVLQKVADLFQKTNGSFRIFLVKAPSLTDSELEDMATYVDARFINTDSKVGQKVSDIKPEDFGYAEKVIVNYDGDLVILGGKGTQAITDDNEYPNTKVARRVMKLKEMLSSEDDSMFRIRIERRIQTLEGGVGIIRVGAQTDTERAYLKLKVEDAINASKAALQMGVIRGGGLPLKELGEKHKDFFISEALSAPYYQIQRNSRIQNDLLADMDQEFFKIDENVFDPVKVTISALQAAVSIASKLITVDTIEALKHEKNYEINEVLD